MRELVGPVLALLAEQPGEVFVGPLDLVHRDMGRGGDRAGGGVDLGDAHEEPWWVDAGLGREPDEAACAVIAGAGRDDVHRVVERVEERIEIDVGRHAQILAWRDRTNLGRTRPAPRWGPTPPGWAPPGWAAPPPPPPPPGWGPQPPA